MANRVGVSVELAIGLAVVRMEIPVNMRRMGALSCGLGVCVIMSVSARGILGDLVTV